MHFEEDRAAGLTPAARRSSLPQFREKRVGRRAITYQSFLEDSRSYELLWKCDEGVAAETRANGCECGGVLHTARYRRKPRGGPDTLGPEMDVRFSFCCAREGCRRRVTPPSLRFLDRKVFFAVIVLLVPVLREGLTPKRMRRLRERFQVSERTVRRWARFWRETFPTSRRWQVARGRFATPVEIEAMPASLVEAFSHISDVNERMAAVLKVVTVLPD
ncbi:MAG: hypothetical protein ACXW5U_27105 [Thermoanaerobaculia bacterium]